ILVYIAQNGYCFSVTEANFNLRREMKQEDGQESPHRTLTFEISTENVKKIEIDKIFSQERGGVPDGFKPKRDYLLFGNIGERGLETMQTWLSGDAPRTFDVVLYYFDPNFPPPEECPGDFCFAKE